jgi:hypothetical protein
MRKEENSTGSRNLKVTISHYIHNLKGGHSMKKFLSLMLSVVMSFTLAIPAFAADTTETAEYLTIYNEEKNTVQAVIHNTITDEYIYGPEVEVESTVDTPTPAALGADVHQDTFLNFEYDIWYDTQNGDEWNLERPKEIFSQGYFKTYQNDDNYSMLRDYKNDVDALNAAELAAIPLISLAAFNIVKAAIASHAAVASGGTLSPAAIKSIQSAIKATGAAAVSVGVVCSCYNNCALSYKYALNHTDNIHY